VVHPEATTLKDQLEEFLKRKTHLAFVVDEYGEVMGLVTLEDILEEIVGDIRDEHDIAVQGLRAQKDGSVLGRRRGSAARSQPRDGLGSARREATTIAGLVIHEAGAIPEAGQSSASTASASRCSAKIRNRITSLKVTPRRARRRDFGGGGSFTV